MMGDGEAAWRSVLSQAVAGFLHLFYPACVERALLSQQCLSSQVCPNAARTPHAVKEKYENGLTQSSKLT